MEKISRLFGRAVVLPMTDVDTDQIIPARFLKTTSREGVGAHLFHDWRFDAAGRPRAEFPLNRAEARGAVILVAGDNFGCGSSREHAAWALVQFGFRAVISSAFADIFRQNALKNALLPITLPRDQHEAVRRAIERDPDGPLSIDLERQRIEIPGAALAFSFNIDVFARQCLLEGIDELDYILRHAAEIAAFERTRVGSLVDTTSLRL